MSTLVLSKNYKKLYELQKQHKWGRVNQDFPQPDDWVGKRIGIAGYGSIGRQGQSSPGISILDTSEGQRSRLTVY